jgi:hypothetical protein
MSQRSGYCSEGTREYSIGQTEFKLKFEPSLRFYSLPMFGDSHPLAGGMSGGIGESARFY